MPCYTMSGSPDENEFTCPHLPQTGRRAESPWPRLSRLRRCRCTPETTFTAAVTGMANLLVTVTCRDLAALYAFVTTKVGPLPAVRQVETVPVLHRLKQAGTRVRDGRLSAT